MVGPAVSHPGHDDSREIAERSAYLKTAKRDLSHCAKRWEHNGFQKRTLARRDASVRQLKARNALRKRTPVPQAASTTPASSGPTGGFPSGTGAPGDGGPGGNQQVSLSPYGSQVANLSHESSLSVTADPSYEDAIFDNLSCVLSPEGEVGPYYVSGELIRQDIAEDQVGVDVTIDGQFIDIETCEPIKDLYWDVWHCNSTGVYAGVTGSGNGNEADTSSINSTFHRGLQSTDAEGVAQFQTKFPGHYSGRTTHIRVVSQVNGTVLPNRTYSGASVNHIGQLFFDQSLTDQVNALSPYNTSTATVVENDVDHVFAVEALDGSDPVFNWVQLGDSIEEDGLFAWITIGIDVSASYEATAAENYGANGGVAN